MPWSGIFSTLSATRISQLAKLARAMAEADRILKAARAKTQSPSRRRAPGGTGLDASQRPVTAADLARLPDYLRAAQEVVLELLPGGRRQLKFTARTGGETVVAIVEIGGKRRQLTLVSMRIYPHGGGGGGAKQTPGSPHGTPPTVRPDTLLLNAAMKNLGAEGAGSKPGGGTADPGAEGAQGVIPGAERISDRELAEHGLDAPLRTAAG